MTQPTRNDPPLWTPPPEFLRELPDMISGKEPELLKPEARAWMLRDPQARELAQQICGAIAMFADLPSRMTATAPEPLSLRAKRSVERAARQLPQRLAEVLWPLLMIEIDRVAVQNCASLIDPTATPGSLEAAEPALTDQREVLLEALRRSNRGKARRILPVVAAAAAAAAANRVEPNAMNRAKHLIAALESLIDAGPLSRWSALLLHRVSQDRTCQLSEWSEFVRIHSRITTNYHAHVLQTAALAFEAGGRVLPAIDLCETVIRDYRYSPACAGAAYSGLKLACRVGDTRLQRVFLENLEFGLVTTPAQLSAWQRQFLLDAEDWLDAFCAAPPLVGDLLALLGRPPQQSQTG